MTNEYSAFLQYSQINAYASGVCALIFIILLSLDAYKAFKRKADWIPGDSLVFNALIIQLVTFIDNFNLDVNSNDKTLKHLQLNTLILNPLRSYIRRVMICIFISYVFPRVVRLGLRTLWSNIGALALPIIWHMVYEVYFLVNVINEETSSSIHVIMEQTSSSTSPDCTFNIRHVSGRKFWQQCRSYRIWFTVSYATLFTALVFLVVLLSCTVIAGKSIRKIISQKVPLALSCCSNCPQKQVCENIENHVLKCWIVSRASQPDYIMARSVFTSFGGVVNTVCFALLLVTWKRELQILGHRLRRNMLLHWARMVFILIGWIVVLFRWFRAVMYFPRDVRRLFQMEDFWTRSIVDMKNDVHEHLASGLFQEKIKLERAPIQSIVVNLVTTFIRLYSLLFIILLWLQKLMVSLSKACWCLSELAFRLIRPFIMGPEKNALLYGLSVPETDEFSQYKEALDIIRMPGEMAYSLWIANISAFKKVKNNLKKGFEEGKGTCAELVILMGYKTVTVEDEIPSSLKEEKHFHEVGKSSCKLRAISLIHFMMYFYDGTNYNVIDDSLKAYSQAWWFMDIVDSVDPEGHLASLTAKKEFDTLMKIWSCVNPSNETVSKKLLEEKIKSPLKQLMEQCEKEEGTAAIEGQQDSIDWMAAAAKISLYKVWKTMDPESSSVNAIDHLRCLLANIMAHCMAKELDKAVISNCRKWVEEGREKEIFDAAFIAGKAKAVREKIEVRDQTEVVAGEGRDINEIESVVEVHRQISSHSPAILEIE